ncbi:glycerate kinase [Roseivirga sp. E12]|uniref:glycerate kinase family protein n=1 Tax=Roseivirga sp. E12 TaxID=2819237 RepID=UPI001ABC4720|nr:glycerate kinase [Roseivirga sp. E12]MBO3699423.1 glycerate kinase [Roseivirga sp. E12]
MKLLVCPDKFKGSLTATEVCAAIDRGLKRLDSSVETRLLPLADGGEGTLNVLESILPTKRIILRVSDPLFRPIEVYYLRHDSMAFIEMAMASGLQLLSPSERNPLKTTTYGTGEIIRHAVNQGVDEIYLLIGGSATNDGGIGMAHALGFEFMTKANESFEATGAGLANIVGISNENCDPSIRGVRFTVLSDVQNPLLGKRGASQVYGAQKGADDEQMIQLDRGMSNLASVLNNGNEHAAGSGAAGGLGYGAMSFLNAEIQSGIETVLEIVDFDKILDGVDLVITGEGKLDSQSLEGKVVAGVMKASKIKNIPIGIICGLAESETKDLLKEQVFEVKSLMKNDMSLAYALAHASELTERSAYDMLSNFKTHLP